MFFSNSQGVPVSVEDTLVGPYVCGLELPQYFNIYCSQLTTFCVDLQFLCGNTAYSGVVCFYHRYLLEGNVKKLNSLAMPDASSLSEYFKVVRGLITFYSAYTLFLNKFYDRFDFIVSLRALPTLECLPGTFTDDFCGISIEMDAFKYTLLNSFYDKAMYVYRLYVKDPSNPLILYDTHQFFVDFDVPWVGPNSLYRKPIETLFDCRSLHDTGFNKVIKGLNSNVYKPSFIVGNYLVPADSNVIVWRKIRISKGGFKC